MRRNLTFFMTNCVYFYLGKNACSISHTVRHVLKLRRSNRSSAFFVRSSAVSCAFFIQEGKNMRFIKGSIGLLLSVLLVISVTIVPVSALADNKTEIKQNTFSENDNNTNDSVSNEKSLPQESTPDNNNKNKKSKITTGAENSSNEIVTPSSSYYTRGEWLHNLNVVFSFTVENEDDMPDNYFSDLKTTDTYYRDVLLAVEFGVVECDAGEEVRPNDYATRDFAASTLNFCLGYQLDNETYTFSDVADTAHPVDAQVAVNREWFTLSDGKFNPNGYVNSSQGSKMFSDAKSTIENTKIDNNYNNNYDFADDVKVVPQGTEVSVDEKNVVEINNYNGNINSGDRFAVFVNEIPSCYIAKTVTKNGSLITIITEETELDNVVNNADAQGNVDVLDNYFEVADGVEVVDEEFEDVPTGSNYSVDGKSKMLTGADTSKKSLGAHKTVKSKTLKIPFKLGKADCSITAKLTNLSADYKVNAVSGYYMAKFNGNADITASAKVSDIVGALGGLKSIDLCTIRIPGFGAAGYFLDFSVSGKITLNYKTGFSIGAERSRSGGARAIKEFNQKSFTVTCEVEAAVGLRASVDINVMQVIKGSAYFKVGIKATFESKSYNDGKKPKNCTTIKSWLYADFGVYLNIGIGSYSNSLFSYNESILNEKNSPFRLYYHFEDGVQVNSCARTGKKFYSTPYNSTHGWSSYGNGTYGLDSEGNQVKLYDYTVDNDGNATITKYYGKAYYLNIPEELDGYKVIEIGKNSFANNLYLKNVLVPDIVTRLGRYAFSECDNLESIVLSKTLKTIESPAFLRCKKLKKVNIPRTLETIDFGGTIRGVFEDCESLSDVTIEDGITRIPESLFEKCTGLREIKIPNTVTTICEYALLQCVNLKNVYYCSSETDWKKIFISNGNDCLENAIIHFNSSLSVPSETQPITEAPTDITANQTEPITDKPIESAVTEPTETVTIVPSTEPVEPPQPNTTEPTEASKPSITDSTEPITSDSWVVVKAPTCDESGVEVNYSTQENRTIPALGHNTKVVGKKTATYFAKGYTGNNTCTVCGKVISKGKAIAKLKLATPKVKITAGKKKLTVKYTKVKDATGFQVKYTYKGKTTTKTFTSKKSVTKTIKRLKKGAYKVKVRALIKSKGKTAYSSWTKVKQIKVK